MTVLLCECVESSSLSSLPDFAPNFEGSGPPRSRVIGPSPSHSLAARVWGLQGGPRAGRAGGRRAERGGEGAAPRGPRGGAPPAGGAGGGSGRRQSR